MKIFGFCKKSNGDYYTLLKNIIQSALVVTVIVIMIKLKIRLQSKVTILKVKITQNETVFSSLWCVGTLGVR